MLKIPCFPGEFEVIFPGTESKKSLNSPSPRGQGIYGEQSLFVNVLIFNSVSYVTMRLTIAVVRHICMDMAMVVLPTDIQNYAQFDWLKREKCTDCNS